MRVLMPASFGAEPILEGIAGAVLASTIALFVKAAIARRSRNSDMSLIRKELPRVDSSTNFDPLETDPGLLRKHSTFQSFTTRYAVYPRIRTFYRPHPQLDKLPSKPHPIPILVFVHGLGGSLVQFKAILTSLVDVAPCLGIDLPGCGRSEFAPTDWSAYEPTALAELIKVVIGKYTSEGQGYILVGHSLGCSISAGVALSSLNGGDSGPEVLGLIGICPAAQAPAGRAATILKGLLSIPTPLFNLWRAWDKRGGPSSKSVARFVGKDADIEVKRLQERFNAQSQTSVYRRMAWGVFPHGSDSPGMPGLDTWAQLKIPIHLIGGDGDTVTAVQNVAQIARALGRTEPFGASSNLDKAPSDIRSASVTVSPKDGDLINEAKSPIDLSEEHDSKLTILSPRSGSSTSGSSSSDTYIHRRPVLKTSILPFPAAHGLLYDPATSRILAGLIQGFLPSHIDTRLSLGWQLQRLSSDGKWDVKNLEKWRSVRPVSEPIGNVFRAMKTLREIDDQHSPAKFADQWRGIIMAVVDISHESPVYNPKGLDDRGIEYHKFPTVSKIPPTREETREFAILVDQLRRKFNIAQPPDARTMKRDATSDPNQHITGFDHGASDDHQTWIGVHCHYGFNRTGFFICSYLIEKEGYRVQTAVDEFAKARPPGIKHPHFLDELWVRYCVGLKRADTLS